MRASLDSVQPRAATRLSLNEARATLAARLRDRLPELEPSIATRVYAIAEPRQTADPEYLHGLRNSLTAALEFALAAIERGEQRAPAIPPSLLTQARLAARNAVSLDTVLRRYFAGYALLGELIYTEAEESGIIGAPGLQYVLRGQSAVFDRLLAAVSEEYRREAAGRSDSAEQRLAARVERLLAGEPVDVSGLGYDFDQQHIGLVASGSGVHSALRDLAGSLDRSLLLVRRDEVTSWAWLGGRREIDLDHLRGSLAGSWPEGLILALGDPAGGLSGWRLSHRQAMAALPIATSGPEPVVHHRDVALLASILQDDLLAASLRSAYLAPLAEERDGGRTLCTTLRAYFDAGGNAASTAAALGVNRGTVASRLRSIEKAIGRPLTGRTAEVEGALRLAEWEAGADPSPSTLCRAVTHCVGHNGGTDL